MPRRNSPPRRRGRTPVAETSAREGSHTGGVGERSESWRGIEYRVRSVSGSGSAGPYRCPGCDQLLAASIPHVVAWPADDLDASDRRHWHSGCWTARARRAPGVQRSRNAPRYG
ncbi:hypothetical protein [Jatrophihabitans lederbergiae]|uniref:hypothetical protein n=1 Tax=Jatrophihabitans lederbergiae TaxID=3075547 RepID=UPI0037BF014B